jgi:ankyrin repeat protein
MRNKVITPEEERFLGYVNKGDFVNITLMVKSNELFVNKLSSVYGKSPFHEACYTKNLKLMQLLIKLGASVNKTDSSDMSPLQISMSNKDMRMVRLLINNDANPNTIHDGMSIFHMVCLHGSPKLVSLGS